MADSNVVYLLLGSNIEPRLKYIDETILNIESNIGDIIKRSKLYSSKPLGFVSSQLFLNQVIVVATTLSDIDVLNKCLEIESKLGRERVKGCYSSRTIDIDILYYNKDIIEMAQLEVPHPRLHERMFTLVPLTEVSPDFVHPVLNKDHITLIEQCSDRSKISIFNR